MRTPRVDITLQQIIIKSTLHIIFLMCYSAKIEYMQKNNTTKHKNEEHEEKKQANNTQVMKEYSGMM